MYQRARMDRVHSLCSRLASRCRLARNRRGRACVAAMGRRRQPGHRKLSHVRRGTAEHRTRDHRHLPAPGDAAAGADVLDRLRGQAERQLRQVADAGQPGHDGGRLWLGRIPVLHRLLPVRGAEQPDPGPGRRPAVVRAHHGDMGFGDGRAGLHHGSRHVLCVAVPAGGLRGRILPGRAVSADGVGAVRAPGADGGVVHDRLRRRQRRGRADLRQLAGPRWGVGPARLAVGVPGDWRAGGADGRRHLVRPGGRAGDGALPQPGAKGLAARHHRRRGPGGRQGGARQPAERPDGRAGAVAGLHLRGLPAGGLWAELLAAHGGQGVRRVQHHQRVHQRAALAADGRGAVVAAAA